MIHNIIFDLDGTLLDTTDGVLESAAYAAEKLRLPALPYETLLKFVGPPIQNSFMKYYGCNYMQAQQAANIFRDYYKNEALFKARPYDGIFDLCSDLKSKGKKLSVATYKREDYAIMLLKHFGFNQYFDYMHGADNNNQLTKADIVDICINDCGGNRYSTVLIGDTVHDAMGAKYAGIMFIAVTYGFGFKAEDDVVYSNIGICDCPHAIYDVIMKTD